MDSDSKNFAKSIEKLEDARGLENWKSCLAIEARSALARDIINGTEKQPTLVKDDPESIKIYNDWEKRDAKMQKFIVLSVGPMVMTRIRKLKSSHEMFVTVCDMFKPEAGETLLQLRHAFDTMVWEKKEAFDQFYSRLSVARDDVEEAGGTISDTEMATRLLNALPPSYEYFRQMHRMFINIGRVDVDLNELVSALRKESQIQNKKNLKEKEKELKVPGAIKAFNAEKRKENFSGKCFKCGKTGHKSVNCRREMSESSRRQSSEGSHAKQDDMNRILNLLGEACLKNSNEKNKAYPQKNDNNNGRKQKANYAIEFGDNSQDARTAKYEISDDEGQGNDTAWHYETTDLKEVKETKPEVGIATSAVSFFNNNCDSNKSWIWDTGCTNHTCGMEEAFINMKQTDASIIGFGNDILKAGGIGDIELISMVKGEKKRITLKNVYYVPGRKGKENLFSAIQAFKEMKLSIHHQDGKTIYLGIDDELMFEVNIKGKLPFMNVKVPPKEKALIHSTLELWHKRFLHTNTQTVKRIAKNKIVTGLNEKIIGENFECEKCPLGKLTRKPSYPVDKSQSKPGRRMYLDTAGPFEVETLRGRRYYILMKDEATSFMYIAFLRTKDAITIAREVSKILIKIQADTDHVVKIIRTDQGTEYENDKFNKMCLKWKIHHELIIEKSPEMNGMIERENRTIKEAVRTLINAYQLPKYLWAELAHTAVYIRNRVPKQDKEVTPFESWLNRKPDVTHLREIGSKCFVHIPKVKRRALDASSKTGILVGYGESDKFYRVYLAKERQVVEVKDVKIIEQSGLNTLTGGSKKDEEESTIETPEREKENYKMKLRNHKSLIANDDETIERIRLNNQEVYYIPRTYKQAVKAEDASEWLSAMTSELQSLEENDTWTLVERPNGRRIIDNRWVFQIKKNLQGHVIYKARLVARGFTQIEGVDYDETFSPVTRYDSIRLLLALSAQYESKIRQFDVKTAFLNAPIDREIYVRQPEGFEDGTDRVCKLKKSLYGLCQSPRLWYDELAKSLTELGFDQVVNDPCIFMSKRAKGKLILLIYVDDGLLIGEDIKEINDNLRSIARRYNITVSTNDKNFTFLGMDITMMDDGKILVSMENKIERLVDKFGLSEAKESRTPMEVNFHLELSEQPDSSLKTPYRQLIGSLLFLSSTVRPDISFSVNKMSQFVENATGTHFKAAKRILRYLKGTSNLNLVYGQEKSLEVTAFTDADWAADKLTRHSTSGAVILINRSPVSWFARKQKSLSQNTCEAEFFAANEGAKSLLWTLNILDELKMSINKPLLLCDSQSAICLSRNNTPHSRSKHIDLREKLVRKCVKEEIFDLKYIASEANTADIFTKPLSFERHQVLTNQLLTSKPKKLSSPTPAKKVTSKMLKSNLAFTMLTLICLTDCTYFNRESPVIWKKSQREIVKGSIIVHFNIEPSSPCRTLSELSYTYQLKRGNKSTSRVLEENRMYERKTECEKLYHSEIVLKLEALDQLFHDMSRRRRHLISVPTNRINSTQPHTQLIVPRKRRNIWSYAAPLAAAVPFLLAPAATAMSVVVVAAVTFGWWTVTTVKSLESEVKTVTAASEAHQRVIEAVERDLVTVRDTIKLISAQVETVERNMYELAQVVSEVTSKLTLIGHDLREARMQMREGKLATQLLAAFNLSTPNCEAQCPIRLMKPLDFRKVKHTRGNDVITTYRYTVNSQVIDTGSVVLEASPFKLTYENATHRCDKIYQADQFMMFNTSIKQGCALYSFTQTFDDLYYNIEERCHSAEETKWKVEGCRLLNSSQPDRIQVKSHLYRNYVYCYPEKIELDGKQVECPNYVFSLPLRKSFKVKNFYYAGQETEVNVTLQDQLISDTIRLHVPQEGDGYWFELETEKEMKNMRSSVYYYATLPPAAVFIIVLMACLIYNKCQSIKRARVGDKFSYKSSNTGSAPCSLQSDSTLEMLEMQPSAPTLEPIRRSSLKRSNSSASTLRSSRRHVPATHRI